MMDERVICAGFGGQGVMSLGQLLAYGGMVKGLNVSWMPSYGPEMRGGTAYCCIKIAEKAVGSPLITNDATSVIVMNQPSLIRFEPQVASGGMLLLNSSMIDTCPIRDDISVYAIPANELAALCGSSKVANIIMLGAFVALKKIVEPLHIEEGFSKVFGERGKKHLLLNRAALKRGMSCIETGVEHGNITDIPMAA